MIVFQNIIFNVIIIEKEVISVDLKICIVGFLDVDKKLTIKGKEGKVISSDPLQGKYKVLIDNEVIEVDKNDSEK